MYVVRTTPTRRSCTTVCLGKSKGLDPSETKKAPGYRNSELFDKLEHHVWLPVIDAPELGDA